MIDDLCGSCADDSVATPAITVVLDFTLSDGTQIDLPLCAECMDVHCPGWRPVVAA